MTAFILGLGIAFGGALLLAGGSELQSRAVYRTGGRWGSFLRSPQWLLGLLLLGIAVSTNFVALALALAPVSAVQAMSIAALAASAVFGALAGRVEVDLRGWLSVVCSLLGILGFVIVIAGHRAPEPRGAEGDRLAEVTAVLAALTLLGLATAPLGVRSRRHGVRLSALVIGAMIFGSITTVFKVLVTLVLERGLTTIAAAPPALLALAVVAAAGVIANILLQRSHRFFAAPAVVAALTIVDPITAATIGITVLGEARLTPGAAAGLGVFGLVACLGVLGVSRIRRRRGDGRACGDGRASGRTIETPASTGAPPCT